MKGFLQTTAVAAAAAVWVHSLSNCPMAASLTLHSRSCTSRWFPGHRIATRKNNNNNNNNSLQTTIQHGYEKFSTKLSLSNESTAKATPTKVVVVGAGISGLSVAYHLSKLSQQPQLLPPNLDVEILEVRNRIGGRIEPFLIDDGSVPNQNNNNNIGTWIDLGGQWLHESSPENPIRRLVEDDLGLGFVDTKQSQSKTTANNNKFRKRRLKNVLFDQDGTRLDKGTVQMAKNFFYKAIGGLDEDTVQTGTGNFHLRNLSETDRNQVSLGDLLDARTQPWHERRSSVPIDARKRQQQQASFARALNYFVHRSEGYEGGKLKEVSAYLSYNLYEGTGTAPDRVVEGSYRSLLQALSAKLGLHNTNGDDSGGDSTMDATNDCRVKLRRNARVQRIEYGGDSNNNNNEERISVSIAENETQDVTTGDVGSRGRTTSVLKCDYCVCTVPLGVLQQRKIEFFPPLPPNRQEAIESIGMGLLNKIVFRFDFETSTQKFWGDLQQFGICHEDPSSIKTYYDCTDDYYHNNNNNNDDNDNDDNENRTMTSAILVQFLAGEAADRVDPPLSGAENDQDVVGLTDQEAVDESLEALRLVFGAENVPDPSLTKVTGWRKDPWSCGSYSFTKVGAAPHMYDEIASPLGRLLFAGEHTSKHCHSTVHGAWETGAREAERIFDELSGLPNNNVH